MMAAAEKDSKLFWLKHFWKHHRRKFLTVGFFVDSISPAELGLEGSGLNLGSKRSLKFGSEAGA